MAIVHSLIPCPSCFQSLDYLFYYSVFYYNAIERPVTRIGHCIAEESIRLTVAFKWQCEMSPSRRPSLVAILTTSWCLTCRRMQQY